MQFLILLLLSPAVICAQRYRKSTNPNDEPFLPIHPDYPYNPKLIKRGLEQQQQIPQQPHSLTALTPELYAPKVDARDSYSSSYSQSPYYPTYDPYTKSATTQNALSTPPYSYLYNSNPYQLLNSYGTPYGSSAAPGYGTSAPNYAAASPYAASGAYPNYFYQPPYYYPGYYNQPPYPPPPLGYPGAPPSKHNNDDDEDDEDDKRREKNKKSNSQKNRLRNSDRDADSNQYVDGANYIISSSKDLDGESSTHRTPNHYNQIEQDSDVHTRTVAVPKTTYRLVSVAGQQPDDYNSNINPSTYIKVQQLEQLMRQALARLLAQNAAQQANLAQLQQEVSQHQTAAAPTAIAKTGLSYVVNPTILNRVNPGQYNPSALVSTLTNRKPYGQKSATSVTLQQSPGIYIPPSKSSNDQSLPADYDYESPESATARNQPSISNYQATAEPTQVRSNYAYSTYRPTQQTNLEDVNFGNKQKSKS